LCFFKVTIDKKSTPHFLTTKLKRVADWSQKDSDESSMHRFRAGTQKVRCCLPARQRQRPVRAYDQPSWCVPRPSRLYFVDIEANRKFDGGEYLLVAGTDSIPTYQGGRVLRHKYGLTAIETKNGLDVVVVEGRFIGF
jgi:hypothetical protein